MLLDGIKRNDVRVFFFSPSSFPANNNTSTTSSNIIIALLKKVFPTLYTHRLSICICEKTTFVMCWAAEKKWSERDRWFRVVVVVYILSICHRQEIKRNQSLIIFFFFFFACFIYFSRLFCFVLLLWFVVAREPLCASFAHPIDNPFLILYRATNSVCSPAHRHVLLLHYYFFFKCIIVA